MPDWSIKANILESAERIKERTENESMPPAGRDDLTPQEINAIACWVDQGVEDN